MKTKLLKKARDTYKIFQGQNGYEVTNCMNKQRFPIVVFKSWDLEVCIEKHRELILEYARNYSRKYF